MPLRRSKICRFHVRGSIYNSQPLVRGSIYMTDQPTVHMRRCWWCGTHFLPRLMSFSYRWVAEASKTWNLCDCWWWIEKWRIWVFASFHLFQGDNIFGCVLRVLGFSLTFRAFCWKTGICMFFMAFKEPIDSSWRRRVSVDLSLDLGAAPRPRRERASFRRLRHSCAFHYSWLLECIWLGSILFLRHCMSSLNLNLNWERLTKERASARRLRHSCAV